MLLWKVMGGLGRSFGGSGLSKYPFRNLKPSKHADIWILGPPDYLEASPTAAGPQTGMGLPNGLRRRKFRSSEIPVFFGCSTKSQKNEFSKRIFEEPLSRNCSWRAYALDFLASVSDRRCLQRVETLEDQSS